MPTYEYICTGCGHEFELRQKITDPPRKRCPRCGKKVERKIGAGAGIIFKGSGFYATDYRSDDYKAKAKAERAGGPGGGNGKPGGGDNAGSSGPSKEGASAKGGGGNGGSEVGTKPAAKK